VALTQQILQLWHVCQSLNLENKFQVRHLHNQELRLQERLQVGQLRQLSQRHQVALRQVL
jgi:hypothetical protein